MGEKSQKSAEDPPYRRWPWTPMIIAQLFVGSPIFTVPLPRLNKTLAVFLRQVEKWWLKSRKSYVWLLFADVDDDFSGPSPRRVLPAQMDQVTASSWASGTQHVVAKSCGVNQYDTAEILGKKRPIFLGIPLYLRRTWSKMHSTWTKTLTIIHSPLKNTSKVGDRTNRILNFESFLFKPWLSRPR